MAAWECPVCGDGVCEPDEDYEFCPTDCTDGGGVEENPCAPHVVHNFESLLPDGGTFFIYDITFKEPSPFPPGAFENTLAYIAEHDLSPCHTQGLARIGNRGLAQTVNRGAGSKSFLINGCEEPDELEPHHGAELYIYGMWSEDPDNMGPWLGGQTDGSVSAHILLDHEYMHPGGIQNIGDYLVVGSDPNGGGVSRIRIFDVSDLHDPQLAGGFERDYGRAEAVGVVRESSGFYLIAVGSEQSQHIDFYRSQEPTLKTTSWELIASYDFNATGLDPKSITKDHDKNYNSINLIRECGTEKIFLAGFANTGPYGGAVNNFTGSGDNWIELHEVNLDSQYVLKRVAVKLFEYPGREVSFSAGATIYIRPDNGKPIVYGSSHYGGYAQYAFPETYIGEWSESLDLPPANVSEEEFGSDFCMGADMKCQVIRIGSVAIPGDLSILGGAGYSGTPSKIDYQCDSPDVVEVYINDRDPDTKKTRWSSPDSCLGVGDSIPTSPGNTYDLRAVSIVGGKTKPFVLGFEETSANEPTQNEAPYITKAPRFEGTYWKETIVFTVTAEDPDSQDRLQILVDGLPSGARFTPRDGTGVVTGNFFWKLGPSDVGSYRVTFTAKDQHSAKSKAWVTIINVCDDPVDCLE
jgi:hypothetical protein